MAARLALLISIAASAAAAREHPAGQPLKLVLGPSAEETPAPARQDKPSQDEDFELLPPEKPPDPDALARQAELSQALSRRRELLGLHQWAGFATLATMTATVVVGQLNYADKYGGGDTGKYRTAHQVLAYGTTGFFAAAGVLALLAPSPFEKPLRLDTATLHKMSMIVATGGMVAQVVLGIVTAHSEGSLSQRDFALAHQIIGYTTWAATTVGFLVLTFP